MRSTSSVSKWLSRAFWRARSQITLSANSRAVRRMSSCSSVSAKSMGRQRTLRRAMDVRLVTMALDWRVAAADAALLVRGDDRPFALCGAWAGGGAIAGSEPVRVAGDDEDPFALLDDLPAVDGAEGFGGGWVGFLGYGLGRRVEAVSAPPPRPASLPDFALAHYDHVVRCDASGRWWFEALWTERRAQALLARLGELRRRVARRRV